MNWTARTPVSCGYYWHRLEHHDPQIVRVGKECEEDEEILTYCLDGTWVEADGTTWIGNDMWWLGFHYWAGPIPEPQEDKVSG